MAGTQVDRAKTFRLLVGGEHDKAIVRPNGVLGGVAGFVRMGLHLLGLFRFDVVPQRFPPSRAAPVAMPHVRWDCGCSF